MTGRQVQTVGRWTFERLDNGSVEINVGPGTAAIVLDSATWCSIIGSLSAAPDDPTAFDTILDLHIG